MKYWTLALIVILPLLNLRAEFDSEEYEAPPQDSTSGNIDIDSLKLGVLFIQFSDWETNINARGSIMSIDNDPPDTNYYLYRDYLNLFFSEGTYQSEDPIHFDPNTMISSPDLRAIYGSMTDYWKEVSYGKFKLSAGSKIINPYAVVQGETLMVWITAPDDKYHYEYQDYWDSRSELYSSATQAAINNGWMSGTSEYNRFAIIYAGASVSTPSDSGGGLKPNKSGNHYMTEELDAASGPAGWFAGIYVNTHEFGHFLGLNDMYGGTTNYGLGNFSLMGTYKLPWAARECPPHVSSFGKLRLGWVNPHELVSSWTGIGLPNVEENDTAFVFDLSGMTANNWQLGEYFIIENRQPRGFDIRMQDYQTHVGGGLLIYHHGTSFFANGEKIKIFEADGTNDLEEYLGNAGDMGDFYPGTSVNRTFDVNSTPNSLMKNGLYSHFAITNISDSDSLMTMDIDVYANPPSAPQNLSVSSVSNRPKLVWNANSEPDLEHYNIWVKYTTFLNPGFWGKVAETTNTYWTDYNVNTGGSRPPDMCYYKITAEDAAELVSGYSNTANIRGDVNFWPLPKSVDVSAWLPERYELHENHPNPFNPTTTLRYDLPQASRVQLTIYDVMGREVYTHFAVEEAGYRQLQWRGRDHSGQAVPSGVYIYRLLATPSAGVAASTDSGQRFTATRKMLLLK